jgi:orotidine-5'-phosphate decarboxylase
MEKEKLIQEIRNKKSFLCIGLDSDITKIPQHLLDSEDPVFEFNKQIIDATHDLCIAYKPNLAFYETQGANGWNSLQKSLQYIPNNIFKIADAKRGDIGNTATMYAQAFFNNMQVDAVTVAPYMGEDSVKPFLQFNNKWAIVLALTSNEGSADFQQEMLQNGSKLYEKVMQQCMQWGNASNLMFVVGATRGEEIKKLRALAPDFFFLVPGVGAQGGSLKEIVTYAFTDFCGIIVNSSRQIIYASQGKDFAEKAREKALELQKEMENYLLQYGIV